ncbi:DMT family transporter [Natrononativus amylolyticus]|uniref:DMT family transporter n=1 Tax=Natrononativus amylolyticus TaxID=2963434 RepID=UPI0020CD88F3|nr:DMT family transporter [Natrononativus amylolyticus]
MDEEAVGVALVLVSAASFGTLGIFGVLAAAEGLSIPTVLTLRFAIAAVVLWGLLWLRGRLRFLGGRDLLTALGLGALGYATMSGLYFLGLEYLTAGLVAIVLYTYPAFVVCFVAVTAPDRVTRGLLLALALSIGGVALITGADPTGADPRGVAIVLGSALAYATYIVVSQRALATVDSVTLSAFVLPAAAASFVVLGLATDSLAAPTSAAGWGIALGLGVIATAIPVLAFFAGLSRVGAGRASILSTVEPAVTVALGALVLAEPVTAVTLAGGALVVAGVVLIHRGGA